MAVKQIRGAEAETGPGRKPGFPGKTLREGIFDSKASRTFLEILRLNLKKSVERSPKPEKIVSDFEGKVQKTFGKKDFYPAMVCLANIMREADKVISPQFDEDAIFITPRLLDSLKVFPIKNRLAVISSPFAGLLDGPFFEEHVDSFGRLAASLKAAKPSERLSLLLLILKLGSSAKGYIEKDLYGETAPAAVKTLYPDAGKIALAISSAIEAGNRIEESLKECDRGHSWKFYRHLAPAIIQGLKNLEPNHMKNALLQAARYKQALEDLHLLNDKAASEKIGELASKCLVFGRTKATSGKAPEQQAQAE